MELEDTMASLRLNDNNSELGNRADSTVSNNVECSSATHQPYLRRSSRIKSSLEESEKRHVISRPVKIQNPNNLNSFYFDKRSKRLKPRSLETIYEEVRCGRKGDVTMGSKKFKRAIFFNTQSSGDSKTMKTKTSIKRKPAGQKVNIQEMQKVPIQYLLEKLAEIKDE